MTVERQVLPRWKFPQEKCLNNDVFPSGRPPFAPFPTITNIMNAVHCPVAIYHDLIHGNNGALIPQYGIEFAVRAVRTRIAVSQRIDIKFTLLVNDPVRYHSVIKVQICPLWCSYKNCPPSLTAGGEGSWR